MIIDWEPVIVRQEEMPEDIDTTSSTYVTYIRKDIVPYEQCDENGEVEWKGWKYLEAKISNADFVADYVKQLVQENQELRQKVEEDDLIIMGGLAETFETIIGANE